MYANGSCSRFATGFTNVLAGGFADAIEYIKERSASVVVISKAWSFVKDL
jgi:hypothetical protein